MLLHHVDPVVKVLIQAALISALWEMHQFGTAGQCYQLACSLVELEDATPKLEAVAFDLECHLFTTNLKAFPEPSGDEGPKVERELRSIIAVDICGQNHLPGDGM